MGKAAECFIRFLKKAGQSYWQILPVGPTGFGDSPYQSFSSFAGNPYFIDLEQLIERHLLLREEVDSVDWESDPAEINYGALYRKRLPLLKKAAGRLLSRPPGEYARFLADHRSWLPDYALFMALKDGHGGSPWWDWEDPIRFRGAEAVRAAERKFSSAINIRMALQFLFYRQWRRFKKAAARNGISIIGDLPFYVAPDSVDAWRRPELFQLDGRGVPAEVAGCPPDAFSAGGQLWGNPLYDWEAMKRNGYSWWIGRIRHQFRLFDVLRIDHFRGFDAYYAIPYGASDAVIGRWRPGPGAPFFHALEQALGPQPIIAEDLGTLTESVHRLLRGTGYPGMRVLEFAFGDGREDNRHLPRNYVPNSVAYIGTHDNEPLASWLSGSVSGAARALAEARLGLSEKEGWAEGFLRALWSSAADLTIVQLQDLLKTGHESRINTPATLGGNWSWRVGESALTRDLAVQVRRSMRVHSRLPRRRTPLKAVSFRPRPHA